ncbi:hypothetical protein DyAD56_16240 [Dyella sp. AD56]|uniref:hypothetical protein n=1 Tax=Dyella sp. AD56 TaxID=1528744 RepID=UPI000C853903|nr:hypothetical protein [Dyella sp. AD56]PMQ04238.1 hypothetical protein DyAD56_16240 [Dyella sp. AD56]
MTSPNINIYDPNLKVTLYKTISRTTLDGSNPTSQRYQGAQRSYDLTPFFGESGSVRTSKSVRDPAGGFALTFADIPYIGEYAGQQTFESLYGLIEPMDYIEIRFRHNPATAAGQQPPIIMRGFVSDVSRSEAMGTNGQAQRSVTVTGQDYGKIWQMMQVMYNPQFTVGESLLTNFKLFERYGGALSMLPAAQFVQQIFDLIVNPFITAFAPPDSPVPATIEAGQYLYIAHGTTNFTNTQNFESTIYGILKASCDVGTWNELFIEDEEDGVHCVFRPIPAMDINGDLIQPDAPSPQYVDISDVDVISLNVSRSEANVANYFWSNAPQSDINGESNRRLWAMEGADKETVLQTTYPNNLVSLYGIRPMQSDTQMSGDQVISNSSGYLATAMNARDTDIVGWVNNRRKIMLQMNQDNVLYEQGSMRVRGNENIRAGMYVRLHRGTFVATYYVVKVENDFMPFQGVFSTLTLERGTGFIERVTRGGGVDSPYLAEQMTTPALS